MSELCIAIAIYEGYWQDERVFGSCELADTWRRGYAAGAGHFAGYPSAYVWPRDQDEIRDDIEFRLKYDEEHISLGEIAAKAEFFMACHGKTNEEKLAIVNACPHPYTYQSQPDMAHCNICEKRTL